MTTRFLAATALLCALIAGYVATLALTWPTGAFPLAAVCGACALYGVARGLDEWVG